MINELSVIGFLVGADLVLTFIVYKLIVNLKVHSKIQDDVLSQQAKLISNNEMNIIKLKTKETNDNSHTKRR